MGHRAGIIAQLEQGQPHCALRPCVIGLNLQRRHQVIRGLLRPAALDQSDAEVEVPIDPDRTLASFEAYAYHRQFLAERAALYDERTLARIMSGKDVTGAEAGEARERLNALREQSLSIFTNVDAVITPAMPLVPPLTSELADPARLRPLELRMLRNTRPFNVLAWPAITLPGAPLAGNLRFGVQLSGTPGGDRELLALALRVERALSVAR